MKRPHLNVGVIGHVDHGLSTLARALTNTMGVEIAASSQEPKDIINALSEYRTRAVTITQHPLSEKQKQVIKSMQGGALIESTSGCHRCDGLHLTRQSLNQLKIYGLVQFKEYIGEHSSTRELTEKGKSYEI